MEGVGMVWVGQEKAHCGERWEPKLSLAGDPAILHHKRRVSR